MHLGTEKVSRALENLDTCIRQPWGLIIASSGKLTILVLSILPDVLHQHALFGCVFWVSHDM
jgi:hypothetical protein